MRTTLLSLLLLSGCADAYDGTWLVTATLKDDSCNPDNDYIGTDSQLLVNTFTTAAGTFGAGVDSIAMTGTRTGTEFEIGWEYGESTESDACDEIGNLAAYVMEGSFTSDGGMDADLDYDVRSVYADCEDSDMESDETCSLSYSLEGVRLNAGHEAHPFVGIQTGGLPGGGGY